MVHHGGGERAIGTRPSGGGSSTRRPHRQGGVRGLPVRAGNPSRDRQPHSDPVPHTTWFVRHRPIPGSGSPQLESLGDHRRSRLADGANYRCGVSDSGSDELSGPRTVSDRRRSKPTPASPSPATRKDTSRPFVPFRRFTNRWVQERDYSGQVNLVSLRRSPVEDYRISFTAVNSHLCGDPVFDRVCSEYQGISVGELLIV